MSKMAPADMLTFNAFVPLELMVDRDPRSKSGTWDQLSLAVSDSRTQYTIPNERGGIIVARSVHRLSGKALLTYRLCRNMSRSQSMSPLQPLSRRNCGQMTKALTCLLTGPVRCSVARVRTMFEQSFRSYHDDCC